MRHPNVRWVEVALLALSLALVAPSARAASDDAAVGSTVQNVLENEYAQASYADAKRKLLAALQKCTKGNCSAATRAKVYVALGMVASQIGQNDEAKTDFTNAVQEDSKASLPSAGTSPAIRSLFADAQKAAGTSDSAGGEDDATIATAPGPTAEGQAPPGWKSAKAFQAASAGLAADLAGKLNECVEKDKESLGMEEQPRTRLHLASCEARNGKLIDALRDAQKALQVGIERHDNLVMKAAGKRVQELIPKIPHVTFQPPSGVTDLKVTFDERPVPTESLTKKFSIDPGKHLVHAEGAANGVPLTYEEEFTVKPGELLTVTITLKSQEPGFLTGGQLKCMLSAKSQEEVNKCLPQNAKNLVIRAGTEVSGYTDTNHVHVASPGFNGSITSPTSGWNVGGNFLVDFVTAASPDIVSMASRHFQETRYAGGLNGGYKPGLFGVSAGGNVSHEPDYLSITGNIAVTADLKDKLVTPRLAFAHSDDTIGYRSSPLSAFERKFYTNEFEGGLTVVMSPTTLLMLGATFSTERGDQSKVYRYVPMFTPQIAGRIPAGATVDLVNFYRLPLRSIEQLPTERDRYAVAARINHRFTSATLRLEERIYYDSWQTKATTTDLRYMQDLGRYLRVWPHVRLHAQSGTNFYQLAYSAVIQANGQITVPTYRTGDRELAPLVTATGGGGMRIALGAPEGSTQYGLTLSGDVMYSRFLNSLFVTTRTAFYGAVAFDAEFQ